MINASMINPAAWESRTTGMVLARRVVRPPIEVHDGRRQQLREPVVQRYDARPIRLLRCGGSRVAGGDRGLKRVRAIPATGRHRALQRRQPPADEQVIPATAILLE